MESPAAEVNKILIVEDEPAIRCLCRIVLTKEGIDVDTAANGAVAQDMIEEKQYDLFLIDIILPEMNGKELYLWLRKKHPQLVRRVIFTSGSVIGKDTMPFIKKSGRAFLPKPFTPDELRKVVKKARRQIEK